MRLRCLSLLLPALLASPTLAQRAELVSTSGPLHFDGVHVAPDGHVYFAGSWKGNQVLRATPDGELEVFAEGFEGPTDMAMDSRGNLYVSNYNSTYVSRVSPDGEVERFAETPLGPAGLAIDAEDHLYVTIYGTPAGEGKSVLRIAPDGTSEVWAEGPELHASVGIAVDDQGVCYVLTGREARIVRIPAAGVIEPYSSLPLVHGKGGGAHLDWAAGHLFAASPLGAIYRIAPGGALHLLLAAGTTATPGGPPVSPWIASPNGLAATPDGSTLYLGCLGDGKRTLVRLRDALPKPTPQAAWQALQSGDRATAERLFSELARTAPVAPGVWFGLGSVHYTKGEYGEAAEHFGRAAKSPSHRILGHYNRACSLALGGHAGDALEALASAVEAGFADSAHMAKDTDLDSLRAHPRWDELLERARQNAGGAR